jgi:predicted permease
MNELLLDVRYAVRTLRHSPAFTTVALLTLALGFGVNTAIFSIVDTVLFRTLPYQAGDRLVQIVANTPGSGLRDIGLSVPELDDLRTAAGVFDDVAAVWPVSVNLTGGSQPERLELLGVSHTYFTLLGAKAQVGRVFGPEDKTDGFADAAVISDGIWRRAFGSDPKILGRKLRLDNDLYTVVGVMPAGFRHPGRTLANDVEVWATAGFSDLPFPKPARRVRLLPGAIGTLKPGITLSQARDRLAAMAAELRRQFPVDYPEAARWSIEIVPMKDALVGDVRAALIVLLAAVALIVFAAAANIASLLLARASTRQREIAMRLALGASRGRLVRQMLVESLLLSFVGGAAGVAAAAATIRLILRAVPANVPRLTEVAIDGRVLLYAAALSFASGIVFGLLPALQASRPNLVDGIREGFAGSSHGARTSRLRSLLIVTEVALAVVLMIGAGLLVRTFLGLLHESPGFDPSDVATAGVWLPVPNDPSTDIYAQPAARAAFIRHVLSNLRAIEGVQQVAMTTALPLTATANRSALVIESDARPASRDLTAEIAAVSPDYFGTMRIGVGRGRFFDDHDDGEGRLVAVVDEFTARQFWPNVDAVGQRLKLNNAASAPWFTIIGVVRAVKQDGLDRPTLPHVYVPIYQRPSRALTLVMRVARPAGALEREIREAVQSVDPGLPIFAVRGMDDVLAASLAPRRFSAAIVGMFAMLGLLLASVGLYGLLAYLVGQRTREIGIRMALGAPPRRVVGEIMTSGLKLAGAGVGAGLLVGLGAAPLMSSVIYGVGPRDSVVFVVVPVVLTVTAVVASYLPARRATRVDPLVALKH